MKREVVLLGSDIVSTPGLEFLENTLSLNFDLSR